MKTILLYLTIFIALNNYIFSQENRPTSPPTNINATKDFENFKDRLYFGGNVGAWFGSTTYINLSPLVGCKINKEFSVTSSVVEMRM